MGRIEVRGAGRSFVSCLHFVEVLQFPEPVFIYRPDGFSKVSVHLRVPNVEVDIIIVDDPGEYGVLGQVVVRPVGMNVNEVQVLHIGDLPIGPHAYDVSQLDLHDFLSLFLQVPMHHFPVGLLVKDKEQRIGVVVQPYLHTNVLEKISVPC